jgi:hypothetical protein
MLRYAAAPFLFLRNSRSKPKRNIGAVSKDLPRHEAPGPSRRCYSA